MVLRITDSASWIVRIHRVAHYLHNRGMPRVALTICHVTRWVTTVEIRPSASIGKHLSIPHPNGIVIGEMVRIGDRVMILQQVTLGTNIIKDRYTSDDVPNIRDGVLLGAGCKVLGGVTVGCGSKIGANAVVLRDVPDGATAVGIPARMIGAPQ